MIGTTGWASTSPASASTFVECFLLNLSDNFNSSNNNWPTCFGDFIFIFGLDEYDLKLAILATAVDTASFHSTKSKIEDKEWAMIISEKYNFNFEEICKDGLCLTNLDDLTLSSLNGLKKYKFAIKNYLM